MSAEDEERFQSSYKCSICNKLYDVGDYTLNGLEKHMACTIDKNLVFINSMQVMKSSLNKLVKNLTDDGFRYLSEEFCGDLLELISQKGVYPYDTWTALKRFLRMNCLIDVNVLVL